MAELVRDLARPRDGTMEPGVSDARAGAPIDRLESIDTAFAAMLDDGIREVAAQVQKLRTSLTTLEDPGKDPAPGSAPAPEPFSLTSVKVRKAASGSLAVLLLGWFFIQTQWPMGLQLSIVFAVVAIGLGAMVPLVLVARQLLRSLIIGAAIAAPLYFGIMPRINQYEQLIPWLCVALFPLLYLMASRPQIKIQALFSAIFVIALLSLDEESQSYSFSSFVNMWIGLVGGFGGALAVFGLFFSVVPEREFSKQVRSFFDRSGQFLRRLEASVPGASGAAIIGTDGARWQGILKQLKTWSSAINYKRVPGNDPHKTQVLIESIGRMALRLDSVEHVRQQSLSTLEEPLARLLDRFYDACVESFQLIGQSLLDLAPVPVLPDTSSLVHEFESRGDQIRDSTVDDEARASALHVLRAAAHVQLLAGELNDCRDKANALDWKAWNQNWL
jgi:hypothetical protein